MPVYEFGCECGLVYEEFYKLSKVPDDVTLRFDSDEDLCPVRQGAHVCKRLISAVPTCNIVHSGNTAQGVRQGKITHEQLASRYQQLAKRAVDHDNSRTGIEKREASRERMVRRNPGIVVPRSWYGLRGKG